MHEGELWKLEMSVLANRLKIFRTERKLTQVRLAELLGVSPRVYNRWEQGVATPHFDTIVQIANLLQVDMDDLAGRRDTKSKPLIYNHHLHLLCQQADQLSDEDQQAVIVLLDSVVKRSQLTRVLTPTENGRRKHKNRTVQQQT